MRFRSVVQTTKRLTFTTLLAAGLGVSAQAQESANLRIASFTSGAGSASEGFFAASIQPSADDALMASTRDGAADVVVIVDTSASQAGPYRTDSHQALAAVLGKLRSNDHVRIFAADVEAVDLTGSFALAKDSATAKAIEGLRQRLPLGNTNLATVLDKVRATLVSQPERHTRSIVYIGDGSTIDSIQDERRFGTLVNALRSDRISVHSIAIGPTVNVELMGILANQTGGVIGVVGTNPGASVNEISVAIASSATMSPIWITDAKLPSGMTSPQLDRLPPLRLDRDSILIGSYSGQANSGDWQLSGETSTSKVQIAADAVIEPSHPDFSFLPGLVKNAAPNQGLMLASAGSPMLRETARVLASRAEALVEASNMALQQGNRRGAKVVAELALEADPNNTEAQVIQQQTSGAKRLVIQNTDDSPFDSLFGGAGDAAPADAVPVDALDSGLGDAVGETPAAPMNDLFGGDAFAEPPAAAAQPAIDAVPETAAPMQPAPTPVAPRTSMLDDFVNPVGDDELLESGGDLLDSVAKDRNLAEGSLTAEVNAQLRRSATILRNDPTGVAGSLKSLLSIVETTPDINPQLRQELMGRVRSAIQVASSREAEYAESQTNLQEKQAGAVAQSRLLEETFRRETRLETLSKQLNSLIDEGLYEQADGEVSLAMAKLAGDSITEDSVFGRHVTDQPLSLQTYDRDRRYRELRERNFVDAFSLVLKAMVPFVDEPPIVYPDADVWQRMSRRRIERYGAIELVGDNETERRIQKALGDETSQQFIEEPLESAVKIIGETHGIPIVVDRAALEAIGLTPDTPVSTSLKNVTLRSFLRLMLREFELTYMIKDEVLQITTNDAAEENRINKVYPVGDLVVPIINLGGGGGGGMGGGMGGGGMGGGMGGGGMGGGMGGGGMGGGGMGGGGAFAVPDDASIGQKTTATTDAEPTQSNPNVVTGAKPITVKATEGQSLSAAWDAYFSSLTISDPKDLQELDRRIRATVRDLSARAAGAQKADDLEKSIGYFGQVGEVISGAMRAGHVQPWMYQALAISQQATGEPKETIERTLLSAVDFAEDASDVLHVAARLEEIGCDAAALKLCQDVVTLDPYRREAFVMGLRIAKNANNLEGLQWACSGVLSQAWPKQFEPVVAEARLLARATYADLVEQGRKTEADAFNSSLKEAASHDVIVRVTWTGDADVDLAIEEPSGTVCSLENRNTAAGGTLLGDSYSGAGEDKTGAVSETYMCPEGFSGQYRLLVRRVWGDVSTGNVSVEVLTDIGRDEQRYIREQIPLTEKNALVVFEVKQGQRKQEVAEAQLANLRDVGRNLQNQVLGQAINNQNAGGGGLGQGQVGVGGPVFGGVNPNAQVLQDLYRDVAALTGSGGFIGAGGNPFFGRAGAVGFRPEITTLPEGASMTGLAIISADRRYVRISPAPFFSQVGEVSTFNFTTGDTGISGGGGGGGGGGGLGGGGGGGGLGN